MLTNILRHLSIRRSYPRYALKSLGMIKSIENAYVRNVLKKGQYTVTLLNQKITFSISNESEIRRVDIFDRYGEEIFVKQMLESIKPGDVCFDVGANIGVISLVFASCNREKNVSVYSFEPEPANLAQLKNNISLNNFSNVHTQAVLLGAEVGEVTFHTSSVAGSGVSSIFSEHMADKNSATTLQLPMKRGDGVCAELGVTPDVMKIDVEGAEFEVVKGFSTHLKEGKIRELFIEMHPETLKKSGTSMEELEQYLADHSYKKIWTNPRDDTYHHHYQHLK